MRPRVGDDVCSLVTRTYWAGPVERGQLGTVERIAEDDVTVCFGHTRRTLKLHQVCLPKDFHDQSQMEVGPFRVGDCVYSLRSDPSWRPQPLRRGEVGTVECYGTTKAHIVVNFGYVCGQLNIFEVCAPQDWQDASRIQVGPFMVGESVRSLKTILHSRTTTSLHRGDAGIVECHGATDADVVVNFGHVSKQMKLHHISRPEEFDQSLGSRVGPYRIGDRVRCLRSFPSWRPRQVSTGDEGVVECYGSTEDTLVVNFGHVSGQLSFDCVCDARQHHHEVSLAPRLRSLCEGYQDAARRLPVEVVKEKAGQPCAICLSEMLPGERCRRLPCLHAFHEECLSTWLRRKPTCPLDNLDINTMYAMQTCIEGAIA